MTEKYSFQRNLPVDDGYDVLIAGGGPAGCGAAIAAARLGAKVLVIESLGCLGGAGTAGLVNVWGAMGRNGRDLVGGIAREISDKLLSRKYSMYRQQNPDPIVYSCAFNSEGLKLVLDEYMQELNIEVRFFTQVVAVDREADELKVNGVIINNIEGLRYVKAKTFIDATGDGVLSDMCDVPCIVPENPMPPTLMALLSDGHWDEADIDPAGLVVGQQEVVDKAVEAGYFTQPDRHVPGLFLTPDNLGSLNAGHVFGMDALNNRSLSDGMFTGRQQVFEYTEFFKTHFDVFRDVKIATTATLMGVRDSRRIKGEYYLTTEDYANKRVFHDQIAICCNEVDLHVRDCSKEEYERYTKQWFEAVTFEHMEYFGIPYGTIVPVGSNNLWSAGRIISCDTNVHAAIRMQLNCIMFGEAAGTAAVQCINNGETASTLNTKTLIETLRAHNGILPQESLCEEMSRKPF